MKTAFLLLGAVALVAACPDDWVNPCIITSKELAPKNERWCGTSRSGYIGQVGNSGTGSNNYVNDWGAALGFYDSSLNIQSYNGVRASGSNSANWHYNGQKHNQLYSNSNYVYLQECSNSCVNHPTCTSFAFEGTEHARNDESRWDNHARGDVGQTGSSKTSTILRGRCYLYKYCDVNNLISQNNRKQWWIGVKAQGAYHGTHAICTKKAQLTEACKNDNSCIKDCPAGEYFTQVNGKNACKNCPSGQFKQGRNAKNACQAHQVCGKGEYLKTAGTRYEDNDCRAHRVPCNNDSYQTQAPTATQDRKCSTCQICPAGTEIEKGCLKNDPWVGIMYKSSPTGATTGAISVTQLHDITNRVVIVHGPNKEKIACGKLSHDSNLDLDVATVTKMPGYSGSYNVQGSFRFKQVTSTVKGSYVLSGLPTSAMGMIHVHSGSSCSSPGGHFLNDESIPHTHRRLGEAGHPELKVSKTGSGWDKNTKCSPCVAGTTFAFHSNTAVCKPVTPCKVGFHVTSAGTVTNDQQCSACSNKIPANSQYYENVNCSWRCKSGFSLTNNGTECSKAGAKIVFKNKSVQGQLQSYENNVISFNNFKCVEGLKVCGMSSTLQKLEARVAALEAKL